MLRAIFRALRLAVQRDLGSFGSIRVNNFFFFIALLIAGTTSSGLPPFSAVPFIALMVLPLIFPLSSGPLDKIPPERLGTWPLTKRQRRLLSALSLAGVKVGTRANQLRRIRLLRGPLGGLVSAHWRGMFALLDTWLAVLIAVPGTGWRIATSHRDAEALPILGLLIALALSTQAQSLFGLDFASSLLRQRMLPLKGWQILFAKDVAWLSVLLLLVAPLSMLPALTFGLTSLAIGHHSSVMLRLPQKRWRFAGGRLLPAGALQALLSIGLSFAEMRRGPAALLVALGLYLLSLAIYGIAFTRRSQSGSTPQ